MCAEVAGSRRRAARGEIGRARADHAADFPDPRRDQAAIGQGADPNGEIDRLLQEIDRAVGEHQPDVDVRIGPEERRHDRQHVEAAEDDRRGDDEIAFRRAVFACRGTLGFADLFENPPAGGDVGSPRIGEREATVRPLEELRLEMRLEFRDLAADGGQWRAETTRGSRQTARFYGRDEDRHRFQAVHLCFHNSEGYFPSIPSTTILRKELPSHHQGAAPWTARRFRRSPPRPPRRRRAWPKTPGTRATRPASRSPTRKTAAGGTGPSSCRAARPSRRS